MLLPVFAEREYKCTAVKKAVGKKSKTYLPVFRDIRISAGHMEKEI